MATSTLTQNIKTVKKTWSNQTLTQGEYKVMATFTISAGTKALILAKTGNALAAEETNAASFNLSSGTASVFFDGSVVARPGSGNHTLGAYYIEAATDCTVQVRQYGYSRASEVTNANGQAIAITLQGGSVT